MSIYGKSKSIVQEPGDFFITTSLSTSLLISLSLRYILICIYIPGGLLSHNRSQTTTTMVDSNSFHPSSKSENNEPAVFPHPYSSLPDGEETREVQENYRRPVKGMLLMVSGFWTLVALMAYFGLGSNWNSTTIKSPPPPLLPRGVAEGVSAKSWGRHLGYPSYPWTQRMLDWQRTGFHFQPNKNWMNGLFVPLWSITIISYSYYYI